MIYLFVWFIGGLFTCGLFTGGYAINFEYREPVPWYVHVFGYFTIFIFWPILLGYRNGGIK